MRNLRPRIIGTLLCLFCATVVYAQRAETAVAVPKLVRFSGSFRPASGTPAQAMESVTLSVYRDQTGGDALWHEIQNVAVDADGHYSVLMGAAQNEGMPLDLFASGEPRWLGVQFNRAGEAEQPRVLLVSVPYALKAADAETLGGRPASAYLLAAPSSGASSVGESGPKSSTTDAVKPKAVLPANSGLPNYIGKFANTTDLVDSAMYEVNGNVGIFTTQPAISLDVRTGTLPQMGIAGTTDYLTFFASDQFGPAIYWDPAKDMRFGKGGSGLYNPFGFVEQMRIKSSNGNVGIATQSPASKLDVAGDINIGAGGTLRFGGGTVLRVGGSSLSLGGGTLGAGSFNTAVGYSASVTPNGSGNIALGYFAGSNLTSANSNNILIGNSGLSGDNYTIRIGDPMNQAVFYAAGIWQTQTGNNDAVPVIIDSAGQLGTINSSRRYKEDIADMGDASRDLMRLRPVTYRYKEPFANGSKPIQYGLIAEEVAEVYPDLVAHSADGKIETVKYQVLDSMLLNEVKRQQTQIGAQKDELQRLVEQINEQRQKNQSLQERLARLEAAWASMSAAAPASVVQ